MLTKNSIPWWTRIKVQFLVFGIAMSILPLFLLGNLGFTSVRQNLEKNIYQHAYDQVTVFAQEIQDFFSGLEDSLTLFTETNAEVLGGSDRLSRQQLLENLLQKEPALAEITLSDTNSRIIECLDRPGPQFSAPEPSRTDSNPDSNLTAALANPLPAALSSKLSSVFFAKNGTPEIYLTLALTNPETGARTGQFQVKIDLSGLLKSLKQKQLDTGEYILLVDHSGTLIGQTDQSKVPAAQDLQEDPDVENFLAGLDSPAQREHKNQDGVNVIGAYTTAAGPNWGVFIEQPASEADKPIYEFTVNLIMVAALIMVLVMILSITFGLKVVQPIENLEAQVRRIISTGDLDTHIPIESWDEVGRLVQSFNQLLNSLDLKNENLKDEKKLLATVVDGIGAGMVLLNPEKKIIWWNPKFGEWFGNQAERLEGLYLENGRNISVLINDERRYLRQMSYELEPDNQENAAYLVLLEDVTQEVELEARMIETDKMAAIGLLASGVAHEINNPLAIVAAHSEELLDRLNEEEPGPTATEIKSGFKIVLEQIKRCKQITDSLLGLARKRAESREPINLGAVTEQTLGLLDHKRRQKQIRLETCFEDNLFVFGNHNEWQQVILNLLTNALDASAEGGTIELNGRQEGEQVLFEVRDHGEGVSESHLKKAFDPFFTTKPAGKGTGLGLYVSYGIIQKMQGKMVLESREGQGTVVKITLPLHKAGD